MARSPKQLENLTKLGDRSPEERREIASKGGKASVEARRKQKTLKETLQYWLANDSGVTDKQGNPLTGTDLMVAVAVKEMAKGNPRYWEIIRDTAGEKPVEKVMVAEVSQAVIDEVEKAVLEG